MIAHCLFEQSGTFKNEFLKMGIPAFDYDILNNFGETDVQCDLFAEIEKAYKGEKSIFDDICGVCHILSYLNQVAWATISSLYIASLYCFSCLLSSVEIAINIPFYMICS